MGVNNFNEDDLLQSIIDRLDDLAENMDQGPEILINTGILNAVQELANYIDSHQVNNIMRVGELVVQLENQVSGIKLNIQAIQENINNIWETVQGPQAVIFNPVEKYSIEMIPVNYQFVKVEDNALIDIDTSYDTSLIEAVAIIGLINLYSFYLS